MKELPRPVQSDGDENATEMMRMWLAHQDLHVSLNLGMWEDAEDCDVDELEAWGQLLADSVQHIANGLNQSHGWDKEEIVTKISKSFLKNIDIPEGKITGQYVDD